MGCRVDRPAVLRVGGDQIGDQVGARRVQSMVQSGLQACKSGPCTILTCGTLAACIPSSSNSVHVCFLARPLRARTATQRGANGEVAIVTRKG